MNAAKWARLLDDKGLAAELVTLTAKCSSRMYDTATAGKILRAVKAELLYRKRKASECASRAAETAEAAGAVEEAKGEGGDR